MMIKKCETCKITWEICDCFLEYTNAKDDLIENVKDDLMDYKCLCCNNYQQKFDKKLKEWFLYAHNYSNHDNNNFM